MWVRSFFLAFAFVGVLFFASEAAAALPAGCNPHALKCIDQPCNQPGETVMDHGGADIVACLLGPGGLMWKGMSSHTTAGTIIMWAGSSIPPGWHLCNGEAGTPNLQDQFIYGAHNGENPGAVGGSTTSSVSTSSAIGGQQANAMFASAYFWVAGSGHYHSGGSVSVIPPYYKLAYLMKM
ncbi:MAG: tail fiber protein [Alphaproteobacteria bacterium]|nr:tail fiber protein [Alphaproteobacteria bacterium]